MIILVSAFVMSCKQENPGKQIRHYTMQRAFKLIDIQPSQIREYYNQLETTDDTIELEEDINQYYYFLKKKALLSNIKIYGANGTLENEWKTIFMDSIEYQKISEYSLSYLRGQDRLIQLKFQGYTIDEETIKCQHIDEVELIPGEPKWMK